MYPAQPCVNGPLRVISTTYDSQEAVESTTVEALVTLSEFQENIPRQINERTFMPVSAQQSNEKTLKDKPKSSKKRSRSTHSSKTSLRASILKGKVFKPFWNERSKEWSAKLSSCTVTDLQGLDMSYWSSSSQNLGLNSWFTALMQINRTSNATSQTICLQSQPSLSQAIMDVEQQKTGEKEEEPLKKKAKKDGEEAEEETIIRARKIRVYPTAMQRCVINKWFDSARFVYNHCVAAFPDVSKEVKRTELRNLTSKNAEFKEKNAWINGVPYEILDSAIVDLDKARRSHAAKLKKNAGKNGKGNLNAKFRFRSRKKLRQECLRISKRDWGRKRGMFAEICSASKLKATETIPEKVDKDLKLIRTALGEYFICVPHERERENQADLTGVVALDPGVRTFQTTYGDDGSVTEWGNSDMTRICRLARHADKLQGKMKKEKLKGRKKKRHQRAFLRILQRIHNLVVEMHRKLARWLCLHYKVVLIPTFESQGMCKGKGRGRKIGSKTVRQMLTWSHYQFRQRLKDQAEVCGTKVVECDEMFTSKTCGSCGYLHTKLRASKVFECPKCTYHADRDVNAARNILIRYLTLKEVELSA